LGARDGLHCFHLVHIYRGDEVESIVCEREQIGGWCDNDDTSNLDDFNAHFFHDE